MHEPGVQTPGPEDQAQELSPQTPVSQRIAVRFGATLAANLVRIASTTVAGLVVAKALGASEFGDLSFLLASFLSINLVLDMGSSSAFYTFLSRRRRSPWFFYVYVLWTVGIQFGISLLLIGLLFPAYWIDGIWLGQERTLVLVAFVATFFQTQIWAAVVFLGEARRQTVRVQTAGALQALVHVAAVTALWQAGGLTVERVFLLLAAEFALLTLVVGPRLLRENVSDPPAEGAAEPEDRRAVMREFLLYCRPLAVYGAVGFAYGFADRWFLQKFGGSAEQGVFSVGQQFANVALIATVSMLNVFWKEIAEALERNDMRQVDRLYTTVRRALYFSAAFISCMLIPHSREILARTVGESYSDGWLPLSLMLIYPVQQCLGQIQGMFFYASKETTRYTRVGVTMMGLGIPVAFFLLAPESGAIPGLDLGAVGLAAKLLAMQAVWVAILARILWKAYGLDPDYRHQLGVVGALLLLAFSAKWAATGASDALGAGDPVILGSMIYVAATALLLYRAPALIGFPKDRLTDLITRVRRRRA